MTTPVNHPSLEADVLVVGAGLCGLTAAVDLQAGGSRVIVLDKGRGVGGRMANRRFGGAVFDHGAQFLTARDESFRRDVSRWERDGVIAPWFTSENGHTRWRGAPAMNAAPKAIAESLDVRLGAPVTDVAIEADRCVCRTRDGASNEARAAVLTAPVPQSLDLIGLSL